MAYTAPDLYYGLVVILGGCLVCCAGAPVLAWVSLEVVTVGMLGVIIQVSGNPSGALKYLLPNAVGGAGILMGRLGDVPILVLGGLALKLGIFPLYFWVLPVAKVLGASPALWIFLAPAKLGPVWLLRWSLGDKIEFLGGLVIAALVGSSLGAVRASWHEKLAMVSTGVGA